MTPTVHGHWLWLLAALVFFATSMILSVYGFLGRRKTSRDAAAQIADLKHAYAKADEDRHKAWDWAYRIQAQLTDQQKEKLNPASNTSEETGPLLRHDPFSAMSSAQDAVIESAEEARKAAREQRKEESGS